MCTTARLGRLGPCASEGHVNVAAVHCLQPEGTVMTIGAAGYPDHVERRASWLKAHAEGVITCEDHQFIARLGAREIWRHRDLGRLMDRLDYLNGPYGKAAGVA